ncbi:MAG: AI-2E family transporter [Planctomycetota bacterium]
MQSPIADRLEAIRRRRQVAILLGFLALILALIFAFRAVLMPFLVALFAAYLIDPVINRMASVRVFGQVRLGRGSSIVAFYAVFLAGLYIAGTFALPALRDQIGQVRSDLPAFQRVAQDTAQDLLQKWRSLVTPAKAEERPPGDPAGAKTSTAPPAPSEPARVRLFLKGGGAKVGRVLDRGEGSIFLRIGHGVETVAESDVEREETLARVRLLVKGAGDGTRELRGEVLARRPGATTLDLGSEVVTVRDEEVLEQQLLSQVTDESALDVKLFIAQRFEELVRNLDQVLGVALRVARAVVTGVYQIFLIMMITAFLVVDRERIAAFLRTVPPERHRGIYLRLTGYIDRGLAGVIRGQLLICAVNGLLTWVGLALLDVRYSLMLGFIAGTLSLIPIFGTILSTIPIVLIAWGASGWRQAFFSLGWILFIHFVEANFLNPKIMGQASKIHPVVIIFALLAGEHTYGIVGALLAVPTASILQSMFKFYVIDRQQEISEEAAPAG